MNAVFALLPIRNIPMFGYQALDKATATRLGRLKFILQFGVLRWALPLAVMFTFLRLKELGTATFPKEFALSLAVYVPICAIVALVVWKRLMQSGEVVTEA